MVATIATLFAFSLQQFLIKMQVCRDGHSLIPNIRFAGPQEDDNDTVPDERGAIKAIHHGQRFSRKLKRRLTQRTIAEARALKKQSKEAIHVLIYAAELVSKSF